MKLTGKCKEEFLEYYWENTIKSTMVCYKLDLEEFFDSLYPIFQNALIIDFFDSVGITIMVLPYATIFDLGDNLRGVDGTWSYFVYIKETHKKDGVDFKSRTEATNEAIIKENIIYNESKL